jgi:hypothetical protein
MGVEGSCQKTFENSGFMALALSVALWPWERLRLFLIQITIDR